MIRPELDPIYIPGQQPENDAMFKDEEEVAIAIYTIFYLTAVIVAAWFLVVR